MAAGQRVKWHISIVKTGLPVGKFIGFGEFLSLVAIVAFVAKSTSVSNKADITRGLDKYHKCLWIDFFTSVASAQ